MIALLACVQQAPVEVPPEAQPDVLLVVLDTTRADRMGSYGHTRPTTPAFDSFAAAATLFEDATSPASWTWPAHASLFTGLQAWEHGAHYGTPGSDLQHMDAFLTRMRSDVPTLAERFRDAGYRTVALSANPLLDPQYGLTRGFDRAEHHADDLAVVDLALGELATRTKRTEPLFLFVNLMPAHHPARVHSDIDWSASLADTLRDRDLGDLAAYVTDEPLQIDLYSRHVEGARQGFDRLRAGDIQTTEAERSVLLDLYDGSLRRADGYLGQLLAAWGDRGVRAVTSDHGEYFGEHGFWEHGRVLLDPILHVPLAVDAPELGAERIATPVSTKDLGAWLLALAGVSPGADLRQGSAVIAAAAWSDQRAASLGAPYDRGWRMVRSGDEVIVTSMEGGDGVNTAPVDVEHALKSLGYVD